VLLQDIIKAFGSINLFPKFFPAGFHGDHQIAKYKMVITYEDW